MSASDARPDWSGGPAGAVRLLAGWHREQRPADLRDHLARYGPVEAIGPALIDVVAAAGLAGRGGAWFPAAVKMRAVLAARGVPIVVANGMESDPASNKDKVLLSIAPHLVLDGAQLAAAATGATEVIVCVAAGDELAGPVQAAVQERARARIDNVPISVRACVGGYVSSEETALIAQLNGRAPLPTVTPPRPYQRGVGARPTLVHNVETLAQLALLGRYGADWFRQIGDSHLPGTALVTIGGTVATPGVYEVELGRRLDDVLNVAGGPSEQLQAVLVGGYLGSWLPAHSLHAPLTRTGLTAVGGILGTGSLLALPATGCGLAETARITRWLAAQNAGQCGPCIYGLPAVAADLDILARGQGSPADLRRLRDRLDVIPGRGACHHPDGTVRLVASAVRTFADDLAAHARRRPCPGVRRAPVAPLPDRADGQAVRA